jgi:hypothetical protein
MLSYLQQISRHSVFAELLHQLPHIKQCHKRMMGKPSLLLWHQLIQQQHGSTTNADKVILLSINGPAIIVSLKI